MKVRFLPVAFIFIHLFIARPATAQSRSDRKIIKSLKTDIEYLADDALEGRRTGTEGERKAAEYIVARYETLKIKPYKGHFQYPFPFVYGKELAEGTELTIGDYTCKGNKDAFPLPFSGSKEASGSVLTDVMEQGNIWLVPMYASEEEAGDVHFDWEKKAFDKTREAAKEGATGVVFYDSYGAKFAPEFNGKSEYESLDIPVAFVDHKVWSEYGAGNTSGLPITMHAVLKKTERTGHNIAAYIDNGAKYTVVLGAHYDHLGRGEDGNSLYTGREHPVHNGADDNASGTAALIEMAGWIKQQHLKHYNYLFVHFSGEELGLFGSKAFIKEQGIDSMHIAYMLNMDMVGRLNDSTHALTLGGIGTSPSWNNLATIGNKTFKINIDSAGVGPSDHTSFYHQGIPVLFFFTGTHHDYHKPTDDADKINYPGEVMVIRFIESILTRMEAAPRPVFTPTRQSTVGRVRFKVTLGIMPDYSFQEGGVKADGVSEGKPAQKAGIQAGDIITAIGDDKVQGMQSYMEALSHQKEGATTYVTILRDGKEMKLSITFQ